jgi:hypothetical protein
MLDDAEANELSGVLSMLDAPLTDDERDLANPDAKLLDEEMLRREVGLYHLIRKQSKKLKKAKRRLRHYSEILHLKDKRIAELEAHLNLRNSGLMSVPPPMQPQMEEPIERYSPSPFRSLEKRPSNSNLLQVPGMNGGPTNDWKVALQNDELERKRSVSPNIRRSVSPNIRSVSPNMRSVSPNMRSVSPRMRSVSPNNLRKDSSRKVRPTRRSNPQPEWSPWPQPPTSITELGVASANYTR